MRRYALADLAALPCAAVVVEHRYSQVFTQRRVRPAVAADGLAEVQVRGRWRQIAVAAAMAAAGLCFARLRVPGAEATR